MKLNEKEKIEGGVIRCGLQYSLYEHNKKLFEYYTTIVSRMKTNCPVNGQRCPINKTLHKLHLSNSYAKSASLKGCRSLFCFIYLS